MIRRSLLSLISGLFLLTPLVGAEHYARVEPIERSTVKAAVAGAVLKADLAREGTLVKDAIVVQLDDALDRADLNASIEAKSLIEGTLEITRQMLPGLEESSKRQDRYYERMKGLSTASQTQKDNAYKTMVSARNLYLSTREKELTLQKQLLDLEYKIATLRDRILKKALRLKKRYLYKLMVKEGEYAAPGTPLAIVDDLSRAKLVIYLSPEEKANLDKLSIWIEGKPSDLKFAKVWKETDEKYISSYRAEIHLEPRFPFSSLLKVELK